MSDVMCCSCVSDCVVCLPLRVCVCTFVDVYVGAFYATTIISLEWIHLGALQSKKFQKSEITLEVVE